MRISIEFRFNDDTEPAAVTGVEGQIADVLLPSVGDLVSHSDSGQPFTGRVTDRHFTYSMAEGINVDGIVTVVLFLDRVSIH